MGCRVYCRCSINFGWAFMAKSKSNKYNTMGSILKERGGIWRHISRTALSPYNDNSVLPAQVPVVFLFLLVTQIHISQRQCPSWVPNPKCCKTDPSCIHFAILSLWKEYFNGVENTEMVSFDSMHQPVLYIASQPKVTWKVLLASLGVLRNWVHLELWLVLSLRQ